MKYKLTTEGYIYFYNAGISKMEMRVLELLFESESNKETAEKLFISEKAVKWHHTHIYKKLKVKKIASLMIRFKHFYEAEKPKEEIIVEQAKTTVAGAEIPIDELLNLPVGLMNTPLN